MYKTGLAIVVVSGIDGLCSFDARAGDNLSYKPVTLHPMAPKMDSAVRVSGQDQDTPLIPTQGSPSFFRQKVPMVILAVPKAPGKDPGTGSYATPQSPIRKCQV